MIECNSLCSRWCIFFSFLPLIWMQLSFFCVFFIAVSREDKVTYCNLFFSGLKNLWLVQIKWGKFDLFPLLSISLLFVIPRTSFFWQFLTVEFAVGLISLKFRNLKLLSLIGQNMSRRSVLHLPLLSISAPVSFTLLKVKSPEGAEIWLQGIIFIIYFIQLRDS